MIMKYNFDKIPNRRGTNSLKWDVDRKELPMWVADMDFQTAPAARGAGSTGGTGTARGARGIWIFCHPGRMGGQLCKLVGKASSFSDGPKEADLYNGSNPCTFFCCPKTDDSGRKCADSDTCL